MSWQRMDENTYIDDTLVTCAEYQLFIDEMRKQGKYYQPDHWASYQFLKGDAREPVLGTRHSDAIRFCVWLAQREDKVWNFRLPTHREANISPLRNIDKRTIGFWLDEAYQFVWTADISDDVRGLDNMPHAFDIEGVLTSSRTLEIELEKKRVRTTDRDLVNSLNQELKCVIHIARMLERIVERSHTINREFVFEQLRDLVDNLPPSPYVSTAGFSSDIFTLQERIAGRSPAFEGIRLVKERIR